MRIGILTFHTADNYGAVLQSYALCSYLRKKNHEAYIVDYKPKYLLRTTYLFPSISALLRSPVRSCKTIIKTLLDLRNQLVYHNRFAKFRDEQLFLMSLNNKDDLSEFNIVIVGSDQVWNVNTTNGYDYYFWGDFKSKETRLISYAASAGKYLFTKEDFGILEHKLKNFNAVSVREHELKMQIGQYYDKHIYEVLDPTFLLDKNDYSRFNKNAIEKEPYILVYEVVHDPNTERIAKHISKQLNVNIIKVGSKSKDKIIKSITNAGPAEFVNLINYSTCVVTTSFHGTAFSIILNKPFYTVKVGNKSDERSSYLLSSIGLGNRHLEKNDTPLFAPIDYTVANELLSNIRDNSIKFLREQL